MENSKIGSNAVWNTSCLQFYMSTWEWPFAYRSRHNLSKWLYQGEKMQPNFFRFCLAHHFSVDKQLNSFSSQNLVLIAIKKKMPIETWNKYLKRTLDFKFKLISQKPEFFVLENRKSIYLTFIFANVQHSLQLKIKKISCINVHSNSNWIV